MKSNILISLISISQAATIAEVSSPNPADETGVSAALSDKYNCLQNGHVLCVHRSTAATYCSATSDTTYSADSDYKCSDKFTDSIYKHSILSVAEQGDCPENAMGEQSGAYGYINFPHGKQKCAVVIGAKCEAPAFSLRASSIYPEDYEIYWAEWDLSLMDSQPSSTFALSDSSLTSDMNLVDAYPRLDENFAYEGDGSTYDAGWPGYDPSVDCGWEVQCWFGYPTTDTEFENMRKLPYGLGQAATGYYNQDKGGWKSFGGQGQSSYSSTGWRPWNSEDCEDRQILIVVVHKDTSGESFTSTSSYVQLEIRVASTQLGAKSLKTLSVLGLFAASYIQYFV